MLEIFRDVEFREFSYEDDPEAIVDMHRCAEVLEGSWFDTSNTCKLHSKVIIRTPGSSWVLVYGNMVFGHAHILKDKNNNAIVPLWRIHTDYRHPVIIKKMVDGLKEEARKRDCQGIVIFGDTDIVKDDMAMIGIQPDRAYHYINLADIRAGIELEAEKIPFFPDSGITKGMNNFLGSPLTPSYIINRAFMAADQGAFHYKKPELYSIKLNGRNYIGCYDGREWHVFIGGEFKPEKEAIKPVLNTISSINPGRILLSSKALEIADIVPASDGELNDFYIEI